MARVRRAAVSVALLALLASLTLAQESQPAAEAPAEKPSLTDRLNQLGQSVAQNASQELRVGPRIHDGGATMNIPVSGAAANGQPNEIIAGTVRIRVDGETLLPTDYALARLPESSGYVLRFLREVPIGAAVEVVCRTGAGQAAAGSQLSRGLMGAPGQTLAFASAGGASLPVKLYYGQESSQTAGVAASAWQALNAIEGMRQSGRREYGFGVSGLRMGGAEVTYGSVSNQSNDGDLSYRDQFIARNMLGEGMTASTEAADPLRLTPEGTTRDVQWDGLRYGDPSTSKAWYVRSHLRMDQNYTTVAESGAASDMAAFLSDGSRWGGRNLVSPWWSGYYAGVWKNIEGAGNQGRQALTQFAGWDLTHQGYGFRVGGYLSYTKSEFAQERLDTRQRYIEGTQVVDLHVPSGGPDVSWTQNTFTTTTPATGLSDNASTGVTTVATAGENTTTTHETLSLTQRLTRGQNGPVLSVTQHQWNQLNRVTGVESATSRDRTTSVSGISLRGGRLDYQNVRYESEEYAYDPSDTHRISLQNLRVWGPLALSGSFGLVATDEKGVTYQDNTLTMPGFRLFEGANVSGVTYQRMRDSQGADSSQRNVGFAGQLLGGAWSASYDWLTMDQGFLSAQGAAANPYGMDFDRRVASLNYQKTLARTGTEFRAGWSDTVLNGESQGQLLRLGASQTLTPGHGLGSILLYGVQYRHTDRWGTLRPSYSWGARYDVSPNLQLGMRTFEHYGAGDEVRFASRSAWLKTQLGPASISATWRKNPLLNEAQGRAAPFLWMGESREYAISAPISTRLSASASFAQNALPPGYIVEASDWGDVPFSGSASASLRPTVWTWDENWGATYSLAYNLGKATLTVGRSNVRFNTTANRLTSWSADLGWQISSRDKLTLGYRNWRGASPIYGQSVTEAQVGHPLGAAFSMRYSRDWGNGRKVSLVYADAGPLSSYWGQNNAWGQEAASFVGSLPYGDYPHTKVYLEFQTPF